MAGVGASLMSLGQNTLRDAMQTQGQLADQEAERNAKNRMLEQQEESGRIQLGATLGGLAGGMYAGATYGSAAGPWGMLIGGAVGAIAGGLFD